MTIVNPSSSEALRQIELPSARLRCGNGRGVPMKHFSIIDSTLVLMAVQSIVIAALLPLQPPYKIGALAAGLVFVLVSILIGRRRAIRTRAVRDERAVIIRWLAIHTDLQHRDRVALAWSEPREIGENQYEFRTQDGGRVRSLVIDLEIHVASLASL